MLNIKNMNSIFYLIIFSIKENFKTRLYLLLTIFSTILIFVGLLLTGLSGFENPQRVLVNTGIAMIEVFSLLVIVLNSANIVLQDIESKSIYLILSKPISRSRYIFSKYLGFLSISIINIFVMSVIHFIFIFWSKWQINYLQYFYVMFGIILKIGLISVISLFLVISMTSQTVAIITSLLVWVSGHFLLEFRFILEKINIFWIKILMKIVYYIIPNFQYFNLKDSFDNKYLMSEFNFFAGVIYWLIYVVIIIFLTVYVFKKKDL